MTFGGNKMNPCRRKYSSSGVAQAGSLCAAVVIEATRHDTTNSDQMEAPWVLNLMGSLFNVIPDKPL